MQTADWCWREAGIHSSSVPPLVPISTVNCGSWIHTVIQSIKNKYCSFGASEQNYMHILWIANAQTLIRDGIDSDTNSGQNTL